MIERIDTRNFYKCVDYNYCDFDDLRECEAKITPQHIFEAAQQLSQEDVRAGPASPEKDPREVDEADESASGADVQELTIDNISVDVVSPFDFASLTRSTPAGLAASWDER